MRGPAQLRRRGRARRCVVGSARRVARPRRSCAGCRPQGPADATRGIRDRGRDCMRGPAQLRRRGRARRCVVGSARRGARRRRSCAAARSTRVRPTRHAGFEIEDTTACGALHNCGVEPQRADVLSGVHGVAPVDAAVVPRLAPLGSGRRDTRDSRSRTHRMRGPAQLRRRTTTRRCVVGIARRVARPRRSCAARPTRPAAHPPAAHPLTDPDPYAPDPPTVAGGAFRRDTSRHR